MSDDTDDDLDDPSPVPAPIVRRRDRTGPKARVSESDAAALIPAMGRAIAHASEQERRARREARITDLIGHDGCGGSFEELEAKVQALTKEVDDLKLFKAKVMVVVGAATTVGTAIAVALAKLIERAMG